jgi:CRISPR system Cascade subunit CasA
MNLVTEPWIPVVLPEGTHRHASLLEVFTPAYEFVDLAVRPHERIALMRLLICIAQAALDGPDDIRAWDQAPEELPEKAKNYLHFWTESFDLFHPTKPFLQVIWPKRSNASNKPSPVSKLDLPLAAGNNSTLFDHFGLLAEERYFDPARTALILITFQNYAQGGGVSSSIWVDNPKNYADAPCKPSSMLHSFIRKKTVFESICSNLLTKKDVRQYFNGNNCWGKPIWENFPSKFDDNEAKENATKTYLGRLVPLSRLIKLESDSGAIGLASGFEYPRFPEFPAEASATIVVNQDGDERKLLGAGAKAIWRELPALIVSRKIGESGGALTLKNVKEDADFDLWVGALLIHPKKTAEVLDTIEGVFYIHGNMRNDIGRATYDKEVLWSEEIARKLSWAVETYREQVDRGWEGRVKMAGANKNQLRGQLHATATRHYWTAVEKLRPLLMDHIGAIGTTAEAVEVTKKQWRKSVRTAAYLSYRLACGQETPRQIRAFALGWGKLVSKPKDQETGQNADSENLETDEMEV